MPMCSLIDWYTDNYSKTSRYEPYLDNNDPIPDFRADNNNSASFKFKTKKWGRTGNDGTKMLKVGTIQWFK